MKIFLKLSLGFAKVLQEQYLQKAYEAITEFTQDLKDPSGPGYAEIYRSVNEEFSKWKWELHFFDTFDLLPAIDRLAAQLVIGIYNPTGMVETPHASWMIGIQGPNSHYMLRKRIREYLAMLITRKLIQTFRAENLAAYERQNATIDRAEFVSPNEEKKIDDPISWDDYLPDELKIKIT